MKIGDFVRFLEAVEVDMEDVYQYVPIGTIGRIVDIDNDGWTLVTVETERESEVFCGPYILEVIPEPNND